MNIRRITLATVLVLAVMVVPWAQQTVPELWNERSFEQKCNQEWRSQWEFFNPLLTDEQKAAWVAHSFPEPVANEMAVSLDNLRPLLLKLGKDAVPIVAELDKLRATIVITSEEIP